MEKFGKPAAYKSINSSSVLLETEDSGIFDQLVDFMKNLFSYSEDDSFW